MVHKHDLLIIDNQDSFTFNLVQLVEQEGLLNYRIIRSQPMDPEYAGSFRRILISPGPGLPSDFGAMVETIRRFGPRVPILGICLGHQAIAEAYGARLLNLDRVQHGVTTSLNIIARDEILFQGIPSGVPVGLYHSWVVDPLSLPDCLEVTAVSEEGSVLAIRHRSHPARGVQFHPESVMTPSGKRMLKNWLRKYERK